MAEANPKVQEYAEQIRDLLAEAGSVAVAPYLTDTEKARFDLSLANPGGETFDREALLSERLNQLTQAAVNGAIAAVWDACK